MCQSYMWALSQHELILLFILFVFPAFISPKAHDSNPGMPSNQNLSAFKLRRLNKIEGIEVLEDFVLTSNLFTTCSSVTLVNISDFYQIGFLKQPLSGGEKDEKSLYIIEFLVSGTYNIQELKAGSVLKFQFMKQCGNILSSL